MLDVLADNPICANDLCLIELISSFARAFLLGELVIYLVEKHLKLFMIMLQQKILKLEENNYDSI